MNQMPPTWKWLGLPWLLVSSLVLATEPTPKSSNIGSGHWAFQPIAHPAPSKVQNESAVRNDIDRFVLARLEAEGLTPSPEAERATLLRRVSLDLIGLPPTIAEVDAFLADTDPGAYERVVDRLLGSAHYGEKWGRHWLDQARYADSHGYTFDHPRTMWPYRDWVINALNDDMPFDRFTIEQLAGDLLPSPTDEQLIATGFHRNTLINQEGGTDDEQFRVESVIDRVNTTGAVWLGLTVGCAQCHDHKYDPLSQKEFFELYAFFDSTADKNNIGPTVMLRPDGYEQQKLEIAGELAVARKQLSQYDAANDERQQAWEKSLLNAKLDAEPWDRQTPKAFHTEGKADMKLLDDQSILVGPKHPDHDVYHIELSPESSTLTAVRLDVLADSRLPKNGPGLASNGNFVMTGFEIRVGGKPVTVREVIADHAQSGFPVSNTLDGQDTTGWAINVKRGDKAKMNEDHYAVFLLREPIDVAGKPVTVTIRHQSARNRRYMVGRFALSTTDAPSNLLTTEDPGKLIAAIKAPAENRTKQQKELIAAEFSRQDPRRRELADAVAKLEKQQSDHAKAGTAAMVMRELDQPRDTRVHIRGDFLRPGDPVNPGTPSVLPLMEREAKARPSRMDLAKWLVDEQNPLTARVTVNRVWMRYFGKGLVETENDFGIQSTPPTHPLLLDWLAGEFMRQGWSMKALHRLIVTSGTYRQASNVRPDLMATDPNNFLLGRQNRLRVDAELVRDLALATSGQLSHKIGGPSVFPPQPDGVYNFTQVKKKWEVSEGPDRYRRTMYTFFYRSSQYPMLATFDVPNLSQVCTARIRSNTPLQSLTMANDEGIFETAQALAARILTEASRDDERLTRAFRLCLVRHPEATELDRLQTFLDGQRQQFSKDADAATKIAPTETPNGIKPAEAAAWVTVARALINLDEFITRE